MRWMLAQIFVRGIGEEAFVDQTADHGEGGLQCIAEGREGVVAVNANSSRQIEPVALDGGDDLSGVTTENGSAEPHLPLQHRPQIGAPLLPDGPRSATTPAAGA